VYAPDNLTHIELPQSAADVKRLLAVSMLEVRLGKLDPKIANTLGYLANAFFNGVETERNDTLLASLVAQVAKLEAEAERPRRRA
jgi:hypothetical protein